MTVLTHFKYSMTYEIPWVNTQYAYFQATIRNKAEKKYQRQQEYREWLF